MATATARRRRSVSTAAPPEAVDALFAFDAPQRFVDLTRPQAVPAPAGGALPPHDAWFDHAHSAHSRPSAELAQAEHKALALVTTSASNNNNTTASSSTRERAPLSTSTAQEKENRAAGPPTRRGNVGARPPAASDATSASGQQARALITGATVSGYVVRAVRDGDGMWIYGAPLING